RLRTIAFVELDRDFLFGGRAGLFVGDGHDRGQRRDFRVVAAFGLRRSRALLRLQRVLILRLAADAITVGDDLGGLDHRHVDLRQVLYQPRIGGAGATSRVASHPLALLNT